MRLFYMPGACSLAPHIALREAGLPFALVEVDYRTRRYGSGRDYRAVNPKGYVPALLLDDGWLLGEVPVILQYVDELSRDAALLPRADPRQRYRALEWLTFLATEIHKSFSPLFRPGTPKAFLGPGRAHLARRLATAEACLQETRYLLGADYCVADAYLFTLCRWLADQDLALSDWPALSRHFAETAARPAVRQALAAEGLAAAA